jgi:hypothetical protein
MLILTVGADGHGSCGQRWETEPRRSDWTTWTEAGRWWARAEEPSTRAYTTGA